MKVKYFSDTDTAYIEFSNQEVAETKGINEQADDQENLSGISFQQMFKKG